MESYWTVTFRTIFRLGAQELQSAAKMDCPTAAPSIFRDVFKGNEMKEFQSVQVGGLKDVGYSGADKSPNHELMSPKKGSGSIPLPKNGRRLKADFLPPKPNKNHL